MPEYLAPGVYVEETSFRSKSIEGVSTSTTAFVGLARKGPVTDNADTSLTPEVLTSFVDFERVFGGFDDLALDEGSLSGSDEEKRRQQRNYLANAVSAYFANGGSRLYVARVVGGGAASAASMAFAGGATFAARTVGSAGNGRLVLSLAYTPIAAKTWRNLPDGTVVREGEGIAATPAIVRGAARQRFSLEGGETLALSVNGVAIPSITFAGRKAEVSGNAAPDIALGANEPVEVVVNEEVQRITLAAPVAPATNRPVADVVAEMNQKLRGVSVFLQGSIVTIATDSAGTSSTLKVNVAPADLNLPTARVQNAADPATNNVKDLRNVELSELREMLKSLVAPTAPAQPTLLLTEEVSAAGRSLVFTTVRRGTNPGATVEITGGTARAALGLGATEVNATAATDGSPATFRVKVSSPAGSSTEIATLPGGVVNAVSLAITAFDADGHARLYDDLGLDHRHPRFVGKVLKQTPDRKADALESLFYLKDGSAVNGADWAREIVERTSAGATPAFDTVEGEPDRPEGVVRQIRLRDGVSGGAPTAADFKTALKVLERLDDISIVAAPGYSAFKGQEDAIEAELITHAEKRRAYRIAVLDSRPGQSIGEVRDAKARVDSKYAALYYPWVVIANPLWRPGDASVPKEIPVPPSGFVAGIYARNDVERGVFKTPANEVVRGALRFEADVNFAQQEVLNPLGVNCLRFFPGRGYRVWGGRTTSSDPEWKYVSVRRYFNYLERSIDVGTQWAVFEPNGERLWANIKETISSFLFNEWRSGALLGADPKEAFFVRCDRSTMDQNDLDNGRLVCLIGVAVVKPAEFVIFRIGQKTADARS